MAVTEMIVIEMSGIEMVVIEMTATGARRPSSTAAMSIEMTAETVATMAVATSTEVPTTTRAAALTVVVTLAIGSMSAETTTCGKASVLGIHGADLIRIPNHARIAMRGDLLVGISRLNPLGK